MVMPLLDVELRRLERDVIDLGPATLLGQRRPIVGQMLLVADDGDRPRVRGAPQLFSGARGGKAAADDDDARRCCPQGFLHDGTLPYARHPAVAATSRPRAR